METSQRPFGYWIKEIDRRIEAKFGSLLAAEGLTRRSWQVLNTVAAAPASTAELDERLAPFLDSAEPTVHPHAELLAARGWAAVDDNIWRLTEAGERGHERVAAQVQSARVRILDGISPADYRTLIALLERAAANIEAA